MHDYLVNAVVLIITQFTAKTLNRQAKKAQKDENSEKARLKKVNPSVILVLRLLTNIIGPATRE